MVGQVAASLVLLIVAGLCVKSIGGARPIDPGFGTTNRAVLNFSPSLVGYDEARSARSYRVLSKRARELPPIESATIAHYVPLDFNSSGASVAIEGRATQPGKEKFETVMSEVDEAYFRTMGTAIRQGRAFTGRDIAGAPPVAIVNETFARTIWPGQRSRWLPPWQAACRHGAR